MVSVIKEMCIFMIIARAVMFFIPGNAYVKYVRVLVGIMMIMGITGPLFSLFLNGEERQDIKRRAAMLEESIQMEGYGFSVQDNRQEIYEAVGQELKERLAECKSDYRVLKADVLEDRVVITVEKTEDGKQDNTAEEGKIIRIEPVSLKETVGETSGKNLDETQRLKELYGGHIGVNAERIEIVLQQDGR